MIAVTSVIVVTDVVRARQDVLPLPQRTVVSLLINPIGYIAESQPGLIISVGPFHCRFSGGFQIKTGDISKKCLGEVLK